MIIPIVFPSAAIFWLHYQPAFFSIQNGNYLSANLPEIYDFCIDRKNMESVSMALGIGLPVSVMCPKDIDRRKNRWCKTVVRPGSIPENSFALLGTMHGDQVIIASPELCFLQAAQVFDFPRLVIFGTELCGIYIYDSSAEYEQRSREPVTNVKKIRHFLEKARDCRGRRRALRALQYILDRSNSRVETMLAVLSMLRMSDGGYRLKLPVMNFLIPFSKEGECLMDGHACYGDLGWLPDKLILEYDSDISHLSSSQHAKDKRRDSAIAVSGYRVIHVTKQDVSSRKKLDELFTMLRKLLGMRNADKKLAKYEKKRTELIRIFHEFRCSDKNTFLKY